MSESDYQACIFARGFAVFTQRIKIPADCTSRGSLKSWTRTYFGPMHLWFDSRLNYASQSDAKHGVVMLGLCVNPFDGCTENAEIARNLYHALKRNRTDFLDYLDELTGAFVVLYRVEDRVFLIQDTAATKPVYFHAAAGRGILASSHALIVARTFGLEDSAAALAVKSDAAYQSDPSPYLPGIITPFSDVLPLMANNELNFRTGRPQRFFPREPLQRRQLEADLVEEVASLMVTQAQLVGGLGRRLRLAATSGRDSRLSAASFLRVPGVRYFSYFLAGRDDLVKDTVIARKLAAAAGVGIDVFELGNYRSNCFAKAFRDHSPMGIWRAAAHCYVDEFGPNDIHVRSTVSEIGRVFYTRRTQSEVSAVALAKTYTRTPFAENPIAISALDRFFDLASFETSRFYNYDLYDLFYWEHRNAKWQNVLCAEAEMATDVFIPYNNRNLLKLFLSLPLVDRQKAVLHHAVISHLAPEFGGIEMAA